MKGDIAMKTTQEIFTHNFNNMLIAKNRTQAQLVKYLGTTPTTVSKWANGKTMPRAKMLDRICAFFCCSQEDLLTDHSKTAVMLPQDILAEEIESNPRLMRLMFYYMKMSDEELDKEIERLTK